MDINKIRKDFPILHQEINNNPLVYLDNAASMQKPDCVINKINEFYRTDYANIHRGVHTLSERATIAYENARETVRKFINAASEKEIVFTRGTTEAINLVAQSHGRAHFKVGDEIIISELEHHSNIVPWQMLCDQIGAVLKVIPINDDGELDLEAFQKLLSHKTKLVSLNHMSNALGTINPIKEIIKLAHENNSLVLIDGAQAASHMNIDVQDLDCDFYAFSAHKLYGPTGVGVLYAKADLLECMMPYQGGGEMIKQVSFEKTTYADIPHKFEAGTPNIAGVVGLAEAINYVNSIGLKNIAEHESTLLNHANTLSKDIKGLKIIGIAKEKASIFSFVIDEIHPHDIGTILDNDGIAIRSGHHCAMPLMNRLGLPATARASFAMYNTIEEVDRLMIGLQKVQEVFAR